MLGAIPLIMDTGSMKRWKWTDEALMGLLYVIPWYRDHAIIADEIDNRLGAIDTDWRTRFNIRKGIRILIGQGYAIASLPSDGFWRTDRQKDLELTIASLRSRVKEINERIEQLDGLAAIAAYDGLPGPSEKEQEAYREYLENLPKQQLLYEEDNETE